MYKVGICDDNIAFGSQMEKYLEEYAKREAIPLDIVIFGSGSEYLKYLQAEAPIDILFLDIELEEKINGIFVGKKIRMDLRNEITQIVYVSALEEYAIQLFQNRPMDFLIKPIKQEDIDKIMNNYIHVFGKKEKHVFEYRVGKNQYRIGYDDIIYFQSTGRKVEIVTYDKRIDFYSSMDEIEKQLNKDQQIIKIVSVVKGRNIYERIFLQLCKRKRWAVLVTFLKIKWIRSKEYKDDYKYLKVIKLG